MACHDHYHRPQLLNESRKKQGESTIWQRRFWEHQIRDDSDFAKHFDYVHVNPLKHGLVRQVSDWPYSSFHRAVERGIYPANWCGDGELDLPGAE